MAHPEETLNVGIGLMHSAAWMPQLLPLFHEIYPDVRINLIEQGDELLLQSLRADDADVVIGGMPVGTQDVSEKLALEQLLLIVPRKFHLAPPWVYAGNSYKNPYEITPQQLQGLPLIMPSAANDLGGITNQALEHFDIQPKSVITVSSMQTAAHAGIAEHGVSLYQPGLFKYAGGTAGIQNRLLHHAGNPGYPKDRCGL